MYLSDAKKPGHVSIGNVNSPLHILHMCRHSLVVYLSSFQCPCVMNDLLTELTSQFRDFTFPQSPSLDQHFIMVIHSVLTL